eukprot:2271428-Alexandrium_andersonii.AAC.1
MAGSVHLHRAARDGTGAIRPRCRPTVGYLSGPRLCRLLAKAAFVWAVAEAMLCACALWGGCFLLSGSGP